MGQKETVSAQKTQDHSSCVIDHPRFHEARLLNNSEGEFIQISVPVVNENEITSWEKNFKALISSESLLLPLGFEFKKTELCGSNGVCKIRYDNYPFLLKQEIVDRASQTAKPFDNQELWYLAFNMIEAASIFHNKGEKVGDIRPENIFINDNGQTKIACQYSWPHQMTNYQKSVYQKQVTYLSPEQIKDLHFGQAETSANFQTSQAFSLGLTLLDSTILKNSQDLYSLSNQRIDYQKLEERKLQLRNAQNIDQVLKSIIFGLLEFTVNLRLKCKDIYSWMEEYRQSIINLDEFQIKNPPFWLKGQEKRVSNFVRQPSAPFKTEQVYQVKAPIHPTPVVGIENRQIMIPDARQNAVKVQIPRPTPIIYQPAKVSSSHRVQQVFVPETQSQLYHIPNKYYPLEAVYESNYVQVPTAIPSINANPDDFRLTLDKIDEQLAISRKMFPN